MLEIQQDKKTKVAVICPWLKNGQNVAFASDEKMRESEAEGLVLAMGQEVVLLQTVKLSQIVPKSFFGKGTLERLKNECLEHEAELLVVDMPISAVQQRNLEKILNLKVIDRTAVILEIFGQRAHTKEGKLQVELAHLTYQRGRLVRSWTHLERQRGGGGFLGGPGETQIELDRRHLDDRIVKIKKELEKVRQTRAIQRSARVKVPYPVAALVGYTNAGKSTILNRLMASKDLTISRNPGTTLDLVPLVQEDYTIYDSPGIENKHSILTILQPKDLKTVIPVKPIRPLVSQIFEDQSYAVGGLARLDVVVKGKADNYGRCT